MKHIAFAAFLLMTASYAIAQSTTEAQTKDAARGTVTGRQTGAISSAPVPLEPTSTGEPHTEMLDTSKGQAGHDPLLEPKPLPRAELALIGGIARKVDVVHNRLTLQPFGGGNKYLVYFDERTRILSGGRETTLLGIHPGDRVYVDTQALGTQVFARTIQVRNAVGPAEASGQVIEIQGGQMRLQDRLSGETIRFAISDRTKVESRSGPTSAGDLHSGSLIDVTFTPGRRSEAQNITIHASPGGSYVFAGLLTYVDVRDGVLALDNQVDGNNYELSFDPQVEKNLISKLVPGTPVTVTASFDGKRYLVISIKIAEQTAGLELSNR